MSKKSIVFLIISFGLYTLFYLLLKNTPQDDLTRRTISHLPLIPFVSTFFFFLDRKKIFAQAVGSILPGSFICIIGIILLFLISQVTKSMVPYDRLSYFSLSILLIWNGLFITFYGTKSFQSALFPVLFLIFMVPIPLMILLPYITLLQALSTEISNLFFEVSGITYVRDGYVFHLESMSIEVADVCSGIRSSLALFITGILASKLFLKNTLSRIVLALSTLPITVFKNGLRIAGLAIFGAYVDERILYSDLHREGGKPFFILALLMLGVVLWILKRTDGKKQAHKHTST